MKPYAIVTASDRKYGDFLIEHWLRSLQENVRLDAIDIVVLDYGLSLAQRFYLEHQGVRLHPGDRDGHVTVIRYREIRNLLTEVQPYGQVCLCDSGDIIFQGDISEIFERAPQHFRAVCEDSKPVFSFFIKDNFFRPADRQRITDCFLKHSVINGGFIVAPRERMLELCDACLDMILDKGHFGPDQLVLNLLLHERGFEALERRWNFVVATAAEPIQVVDGVILDQAGQRIPVVHNAGNFRFLRPIEDFGYGPGHNLLKKEIYMALRGFYASRSSLATAQETVQRSRRELAELIRKLKADAR